MKGRTYEDTTVYIGLKDNQSEHIFNAVRSEVEDGISQLSREKHVFRETSRATCNSAIAPNGYRIVESSKKDYKLSISGYSNLGNNHDIHGETSVVDLSETNMRYPRPEMKVCRTFVISTANPPKTQTTIERFSGVVDVLNDSVFQVTLKSKFGEPLSLAFPTEMAIDASVTAGDFVSYVVVRNGDSLDHEFRREEPPELSDIQQRQIDDFVDQALDGWD